MFDTEEHVALLSDCELLTGKRDRTRDGAASQREEGDFCIYG